MSEGCDNCQYRCELQRWDYSKVGTDTQWKELVDGFACLAFAYEGVVVNMVGVGNGMCEMYRERKDG